MKKILNIISVVTLSLIVLSFSLVLFFTPQNDYTESERRALAKFPELNAESLLNGSFMKDFESATLDQFPVRDSFRTLKMFTSLRVLNLLTANDLYTFGDYIVKEEYPLNMDVVSGNLDTIVKLYENSMKDKNTRIFFSFVPDKNYYFSALSGRLIYVRDEFLDKVFDKLPFAEYIDLTDTLSTDSYYKTDTHWSQDKIIPAANKLASSLGVALPTEYRENIATDNFFGVYTKQLMLPVSPDKLVYLTNDVLDEMSVKVMNDNKGMYEASTLYNLDKLSAPDNYDVFLSGAVSLVTIENPNATTDRELVIFRDSFGSAMAPLLAQGYKKTTVVDLRYVNTAFLPMLVKFDNADILFMYSSIVLNSPRVFG